MLLPLGPILAGITRLSSFTLLRDRFLILTSTQSDTHILETTTESQTTTSVPILSRIPSGSASVSRCPDHNLTELNLWTRVATNALV
jgi:hypothetical protein